MTGQRKIMTDGEIKDVISSHQDRAVTAAEVAERLEVTPQAALQRLDKLSERGEVVKKKVGARAVVWWLEGS